MIAQLGHLDPQHLGVIARTSVMHYQHNSEPLDRIARELGVQYVLEGSVRRDSEKVRITAQLIQTDDQTHIWSRQYDRELSNLLSLQSEIASEISNEIQLSLGERQPANAALKAAATLTSPVPPKNYQAYDDYLKGRYFWNKRTAQGFRQAVDCFEQSVAKDPAYAPAYAGLADSYALMAAYDVAPVSEVIPKARAAALRALSLDEKLAEAYVSLAVIAQNYDWDWQTSEKDFRRAIALDPNYATGHHWYAEHLALQGRFDEAFPEIQRALQLDPLSLIMKADNGVFLYFARQNDRSIEQLRAVLEMEPNFSRAHMIVFPYMQMGRFEDALAHLQQWRKSEGGYWVTALEAEVYAFANRPEQAGRAIEELNQLNRRHPVDPYVFVGPYVALGDKDRAFRYLNLSLANHSPSLTALKVDPIFDPIRSDSRFAALLSRIGLAQ
jgi:tetratricopeptide (TPR) repeat protein